MALVVKDRVKETTATTGTGTLTLAGAVTGFQTFTSVLSNGDTTYYGIFDSATGAFEVGLGTFTSSGTTLARTTILESSNSGSAVSLAAGNKDVFITQPAEKAVYLDASGYIAAADGRNVTNVDASTAATLAIARTIGGVSFDGSANINLAGVNTSGNQDTSGTAATATALATGRTISLTGDVTGTSGSFDGSGNASIAATIAANSVALGTDTTGNYVADITAGTLIDVSGGGSETATVTVNVDLSELSTSTTNGDGDYFVVVDTLNVQRKLTKANINISGFNNDAGYTTNVGDITGVTAGSFLTGGGTSGTVTVDVDATSANTASKVVARDGSGNFSAGTITASLSGDVTGNVSGTAATVTGAAQSNITSLGTLTTLTVDDITINGSTISDAGDLTVDVGGNINLDAGGGNITFKDAGTPFGTVVNSGSNTLELYSNANVHLRPNAGTSATSNYVWNQGNVTPWVNNYFDLGSATYGWKDGYFTGSITVGSNIGHDGDTDTYLQFHNANEFRIVTGNTERLEASSSGIKINDAYTLPTSDGSNGQALVTNGSGTISFGSAGISTGKAIAMAIVFG